MKALLALLLAALAGLLAYNYLVSGELRLLPPDRSAEEEELAVLERRLEQARRELSNAARAAGVSGVDFTFQVEAARRSADEIKRELDGLLKRLEGKVTTASRQGRARVKQKAAALQRAVEAFRRELD